MIYADTRFSEFEYDKNFNMTRHITPSTKDIVYDYDALNRLTSKTYPLNPGLNTTYQYDLGSRLQLAINNQQLVGFIYDGLNRVWATGQVYGPNTILNFLINSYDKVGNRTSVRYPSGKFVEYTYDANNRMDLVKVNGTTIADYDWDLLDRRDLITYPLSPSPVVADYTFDLANQLTQIKNQLQPSTVISQFDYPLYDMVGNRKKMDDRRGTNPVKNYDYGYNNIYELTSVSGSQTHSYQYDLVANRLNVDGTPYVPNNLNQYIRVGTQAYGYDFNGNLASDGVNTYSYDEENRLQSMVNSQWSASYQYDGLNRRVSKTVNGVATYFIYDGDEER